MPTSFQVFLEEFLKKKSSSATAAIGMASNQKQVSAFQCDHCDSSFKTKNGLKIHKGKYHKEAATPEALRRQQLKDASLLASPMLNASREEVKEEKEEPPPSPPTQPRCSNCDAELRGYWCRESPKQLCNDCYLAHYSNS